MKRTNIIYWVLTGLFAFVMLGSAIPDIFSSPIAVQGFKEMGMPAYLLPFLGIAKLLGAMAILIPGHPRIKEWAYAGLIYDLLGATWSVANSGKSIGTWSPMLIFIALGVCAYVWHRKKQKGLAVQKQIQTISPSNYYQHEKVKIADAAIA